MWFFFFCSVDFPLLSQLLAGDGDQVLSAQWQTRFLTGGRPNSRVKARFIRFQCHFPTPFTAQSVWRLMSKRQNICRIQFQVRKRWADVGHLGPWFGSPAPLAASVHQQDTECSWCAGHPLPSVYECVCKALCPNVHSTKPGTQSLGNWCQWQKYFCALTLY